jgi:hypothetical protein
MAQKIDPRRVPVSRLRTILRYPIAVDRRHIRTA